MCTDMVVLYSQDETWRLPGDI